MSKAASRRKAPTKIKTSSSRHLIPADGQKKRQVEIRLYKAAHRNVDKAMAQLQDFENKDLPNFQRWFEAEFNERLNAVGEQRTELHRLQLVVDRVVAYADAKGMRESKAYAVVKEAMAAGREEALDDEIRAAYAAEDDNDDDDYRDEEEAFRAFKKAFTDLWGGDIPLNDLGDDDDPFGDDAERKRDAVHQRKAANHDPFDDHTKGLYRRLTRLLHPDLNHGLSDAKRHLWHEVQEAYEWGNVTRLENILKSLTNDQDVALDLKSLPIGDIMDLRKSLAGRLRRLKGRILDAKREPWWDFGKTVADKRQLVKLRAQMYREIQQQEQLILSGIKKFRRRLATWDAALQNQGKSTAKKKKPKKPPPGARYADMPIFWDDASSFFSE